MQDQVWFVLVIVVPALQLVPASAHEVRLETKQLLVPLDGGGVGVGFGAGGGGGGAVTGFTVITALPWAVPPSPEQLSVYVPVALSAPVEDVPDVGFVPLQAPDALQDLALVVLQVIVLDAPALTVVGVALKAIVGAVGAGVVCSP